ncbi:MAG: hypothetical protein ACEQSR_11485 [Candidatus Methylacidiphilales bacterium]
MKFYTLIIFTFINVSLCQAQFGEGAQMLSGDVNFDFVNSKNNSEDFVSPFIKNNNEDNKYGFGIELGYGKFKKENNVWMFGIGYTYLFSEINRIFSDTSRIINSISTNHNYRYTAFAEKLNFIPIKSNWGINYSVKGLVSYNTVNNKSKGNYYYNSNDSSFVLEGMSDGNYYELAISGNLGAYYVLNKYFLLFSQINVFTANLNYTKNTDTYLGNLRKIENSNFGFNLTGALTPTFKLGDISIGLRYIIPN